MCAVVEELTCISRHHLSFGAAAVRASNRGLQNHRHAHLFLRLWLHVKICADYKIKHVRIHDFETISYCADIHRLRLWAQFEHVRMKAATLLGTQLKNALAQRTCGQWRRATRQHKEGLPLR